MDWNDLRYFLAVAETGTLLGASRRLEVNHSTVFRRINQFEKSAGTRLFDRLADGYHLTQAGETLLEHAQRVGEEIDLLQVKLLGQDFLPRGKIRLTAPENLANDYLPRYLFAFSERYPEIEFELVSGAEWLDLTRREADLAVRATNTPPPHLVGRKVLSLHWGFYASPGYLARHGTPEKQSDLAGHALLGADGALQRVAPLQRLRAEFGSRIVMTCSSLNAMSAMAEADYAIALLPDDQVKRGLVRLFTCTPEALSDFWLLTHPELRNTERIRLLRDHLYEAFRTDERLKDLAVL